MLSGLVALESKGQAGMARLGAAVSKVVRLVCEPESGAKSGGSSRDLCQGSVTPRSFERLPGICFWQDAPE